MAGKIKALVINFLLLIAMVIKVRVDLMGSANQGILNERGDLIYLIMYLDDKTYGHLEFDAAYFFVFNKITKKSGYDEIFIQQVVCEDTNHGHKPRPQTTATNYGLKVFNLYIMCTITTLLK